MCAFVFANDTPTVKWSLLSSGSSNIEPGEESVSVTEGMLYNRVEFKLSLLPAGLIFRTEALYRHPVSFSFDPFFGDPEKRVINLLGGMYHAPTGSRLLYGVLDEWGLSARIRNPWIRSPAYPENHKPLIADLKTSVSVTKNEEAYVYLSSPFINIFRNVKLRGFFSAQTETEELKPALSAGAEINLPDKTGILLEAFFTSAFLPATKNSSWFTNPPPLPGREFKLFAAGLLFHNRLLSLSGDIALSETFAWGRGLYFNFGIMVTPLLASGRIPRPLSVSFSLDTADRKFIYRDGVNHGEGFRAAVKAELKGSRSSLIRFNSVLRAPAAGESFSRSSTGFYYRFPSQNSRDEKSFPVHLSRISLTVDRNADNLKKIADRYHGYIALSVSLKRISINTPFGVNISGSVSVSSESEISVSPFPFPLKSRVKDNSVFGCELTWSPSVFQFRTKIGFTNDFKREKEVWDFSFSAAVRFKHGRISVKTASADFPEKWSFTFSWRLEAGK